MASSMLMKRDQDAVVDNTNHDLIHTLSVRLDAGWHHQVYTAETKCQGCHQVFERLRELDREALQILSGELAKHIKSDRFPVDLSD
jgi:hypothetical protein